MTTESKDDEIKALKAQIEAMDILLQQNAALEKEVARLCAELDEVSMGIQKKGYLNKWRDREISFASKWVLRYFVLQKNTLSYFIDEKDNRPRRTITLTNCVVKDEGTKKGGIYRVFSVYMKSTLNSDDVGNLVMRLSTDNPSEADLWIEMLRRAVSFSDENGNENDEIGDTSITRVPSMSPTAHTSDSKASDVKTGDVKDLTVDTWDHHVIDENTPIEEQHQQTLPSLAQAVLSPAMLDRVRSSSMILKKSMSRSFSNRHFFSSSPSKSKETSLPEKDMKHETLKSRSGSNNTNTTKPSDSSHSKNHKTKSGYVHRSFPASKHIHLERRYSPLSSEVRAGEINYRGFVNLGVIILVLTHFRMITENLVKYGLLLRLPFFYPNESNDISSSPQWDEPRPIAALLSWSVSLMLSYSVEKLASRYEIDERVILIINYILGFLNGAVPCLWVWFSKTNPIPSMVYLFQSVVIWMKLISYAHVNRDLRVQLRQLKAMDKQLAKSSDSNDDSNNSNNAVDNNAKPAQANIFAELNHLEPPYLSYPQNITIPNLLYFIIAPTLCYQLNYPRSPSIRWNYLATIILRMFTVAGLIIFTIEQYIKPTLANSVGAMDDQNYFEIFQRLLKLSVPSTYVWLLSFYWYFHLWLNFLAEITRFGDRQFYKDWWNARTVETYWRLWNLPVHHWMLRHLYYPLIRNGVGKTIATVVVFAFSALFHEVVISTPFRYFALHAFFGMLAQAPLVMITKAIDKRFDSPLIGNVIFWCVFCVIGQPMGVIMYYYDIYKKSQGL